MDYEFITKNDPIAPHVIDIESYNNEVALERYKIYRSYLFSKIQSKIVKQLKEGLEHKTALQYDFLNTPTVFVRRNKDLTEEYAYTEHACSCNVYLHYGCAPIIATMGASVYYKIFVSQEQTIEPEEPLLCFVGKAVVIGSKDGKKSFPCTLHLGIDGALYDFSNYIINKFEDYLQAYVSALICAEEYDDLALNFLSRYNLSFLSYRESTDFNRASQELYDASFETYRRKASIYEY